MGGGGMADRGGVLAIQMAVVKSGDRTGRGRSLRAVRWLCGRNAPGHSSHPKPPVSRAPRRMGQTGIPPWLLPAHAKQPDGAERPSPTSDHPESFWPCLQDSKSKFRLNECHWIS